MKNFLKNFFLGVFFAAVIFFITALTSGGMQAATKRPGGAIAWLVIWGLSKHLTWMDWDRFLPALIGALVVYVAAGFIFL